MQWIDDFIARKLGNKKIEYQHEAMEPALKDTYGVIVYQEQVMQISKDLCGFTGGQADKLRKAIGKKKPEELAKMRTDFIDGGVSKSTADRGMMEKLWHQLEDFAAYCFPKAHAACYALIAYQTAYLKANYPAAFMSALMTSDYDNIDRLAIEISECSHLGLDVMAPDVNESFLEFAVVPETNQIRFGLLAIKNVGTSAVEDILRARETGQFKSLEDFFSKVNPRIVNHKALESLIKAGAFDRYGERNNLLNNLELMLAFSNRVSKDRSSGQTDLFGDLVETEQTAKFELKLGLGGPVASQQQKLGWERELLGIYLSEHPLDPYKLFLADKTVPLNSITTDSAPKSIKVGGAITTYGKY